MKSNQKANILLIYTGGTIGMIKDADSGVLKAFDFKKLLNGIPELKLLDCNIETVSFEKPIDSSNMQISDWQKTASIIEENYEKFDGFVVLPLLEKSSGLRMYSIPLFGPAIFVAITNSDLFPDFLSQFPIYFSVLPSVSSRAAIGYISAVSIKLIPRKIITKHDSVLNL